jgi:large subunit ribosomal protein L28
MSGQLRSHAENKTKRVFRPNLCNVTLMSDVLKRSFRLKISAHALKTVEHRGGLDAFLKRARPETLSPKCLQIKRDIAKAETETTSEPAAA